MPLKYLQPHQFYNNLQFTTVENSTSISNDFQKIIINSNTVCSKKGFKDHIYPTMRYREILNCFKLSGKKTWEINFLARYVIRLSVLQITLQVKSHVLFWSLANVAFARKGKTGKLVPWSRIFYYNYHVSLLYYKIITNLGSLGRLNNKNNVFLK